MKFSESHPVSPSSSFRLRLQSELAARCAGNPQYSLRAFALHLGMDHSTLSQLLRGKRKLTEATIRKLGSTLRLGPHEVESYIAHQRRWPIANPRIEEATRLTRDAAEMIADWYHYAILELTRLDSFRADSSWVARVLGISTDEVNVALVRLCHLGLLTMEGHRWVDRSAGLVVNMEDFTQATIDRLWSQDISSVSQTIHQKRPNTNKQALGGPPEGAKGGIVQSENDGDLTLLIDDHAGGISDSLDAAHNVPSDHPREIRPPHQSDP